MNVCSRCAFLSAIPTAMVSHSQRCLLVWCLTIDHAFWVGVSLSAVSAGVVRHYRPFLSGVVPHDRPCLLLWYLTVGHACWCGTSLSAMPVGEVPHHRTCLLVCYLAIGYACWSTATDILPAKCRWKKDGYKSGSTCNCDPAPLSDMSACTV